MSESDPSGSLITALKRRQLLEQVHVRSLALRLYAPKQTPANQTRERGHDDPRSAIPPGLSPRGPVQSSMRALSPSRRRPQAAQA
jgi:hypothetical protein